MRYLQLHEKLERAKDDAGWRKKEGRHKKAKIDKNTEQMMR